ncbi:MAG: hypothetical protein ACI9EW_000909 [Cellvibrionaceae bacterium]|jgi:hypothetical protein
MEQENQTNANGWQNRFLIIGAILGALAGAISAWMLIKSAEKKHGGPPDISGSDLLRSTVGIIGIIRGIASLGD